MGQAITLRKFSDEDVPLFKTWIYLPHVSEWYHDPFDWIDEIEKRNSDYSWIHHYIVEFSGEPIGFCQYYEYDNSHEIWHGNTETKGAYSIDYMIGDASYLGKGFGKAIVKQLIEIIKSCENAKRIIVQPEPENKPSCNTLLSCGFVFDNQNQIYIMEL